MVYIFITMHINKKTEYAVLGTLYLALKPNHELIKIQEVSNRLKIGKPILLKIFHALVKNGIMESKPGALGGFRLRKAPESISLLDIATIFESTPYINDCANDDLCEISSRCSVGFIWRELQKDFDAAMGKVTFRKLVENANKYANLIPLQSH